MRLHFLLKIQKVSMGILILFSLFFPSQPTLSAYQPAAGKAEGDCTYTIPNDVDTVDGLDNYAQVKPGDVLCLPAGTRENIKLKNLHGAAGSPITVRNSGGKVTITGTLFLTGGIGLIDSSYIRITGTGVASQCGAEYPPEQQNCGIELNQTHKGIKIDTSGGVTDHIEIDHIDIHDTSTITETRGIAIHPLEGQMIDGIYIHHNRVANTSAEGIYVGTEPHDRPLDILGKEQNVEVSYNLLQQIGFDAIKVKVAISNVKVHHNIIIGAGLAGVAAHVGGIKLALSVGDFYNNYIITGCEGINMGRTLDNPGTRYFNNIVVGAKCGAIALDESGALVYNNTVVASDLYGISATGKDTRVFDNIIAGAAGAATDGRPENFTNNWIGPVASAGFVNPAANDYHLLPGSPAIERGKGTGMGIYPTFDLDGKVRPSGINTDLGAYEFPVLTTFLPAMIRSTGP